MILVGCQAQPRIVIITSTPEIVVDSSQTQPGSVDIIATVAQPQPTPAITIPPIQLSAVPASRLTTPTPNPTIDVSDVEIPQSHIVQSGETLMGIAQTYGLSLEAILNVNVFENPDIISVGQLIELPDIPTQYTPANKIVSDELLIRSPRSREFDLATFIDSQPGYIRNATDQVTVRLANGSSFDELVGATEIIERVALEYSIDPRILLTLLEYRAGWLSNPAPLNELITHPLISIDNTPGINRSGLYRQLSWAADQLNFGYYGWKYRNLRILEVDGNRFLFDFELNPASVSLQYFLSRFRSRDQWLFDISESGFYRMYYSYFGDPLSNQLDMLVPIGLQQPVLSLPFQEGETWYYTGGPHGGWGTGSAWAALDFAPPDERPPNASFCYTSVASVTAVADGVVSYVSDGMLLLDLDGDGDDRTGWVIQYLHLDLTNSPKFNQSIRANDFIGYTSCAGGFSTATHLHIARKYNGEWVPADCAECFGLYNAPDFSMSGWVAVGISGQEYQGYLIRNDVERQAEQGRTNPINHIIR